MEQMGIRRMIIVEFKRDYHLQVTFTDQLLAVGFHLRRLVQLGRQRVHELGHVARDAVVQLAEVVAHHHLGQREHLVAPHVVQLLV
jgi:hypothetical protein